LETQSEVSEPTDVASGEILHPLSGDRPMSTDTGRKELWQRNFFTNENSTFINADIFIDYN